MTKTVKVRVREFRQRLKHNPEKYEAHKKKDADRKKERKTEKLPQILKFPFWQQCLFIDIQAQFFICFLTIVQCL